MSTMSKEYQRNWYEKNKNRRIQLNKDWRERELSKFLLYKESLVCAECGDSRAPVLDFHHLNPSTKEIEVSKAIYRECWSFERVMKEIKKCVVLCSNCHRMRHHNEKLAPIA